MDGIEKNIGHNNALDAEPPDASFVKSMLVGGGPVNAAAIRQGACLRRFNFSIRTLLYVISAVSILVAGWTLLQASRSNIVRGNPNEIASRLLQDCCRLLAKVSTASSHQIRP